MGTGAGRARRGIVRGCPLETVQDFCERHASPVLRTCGGVGLIGLGLIEPWLSCCAGVAWGLGASRDASTISRTTIAAAARPLRPAECGEGPGGAAGGGRLLRTP